MNGHDVVYEPGVEIGIGHRIIFKSGQRIGRLIFQEELPKIGNKRQLKFQCDCGSIYVTYCASSVASGRISSCGCYHREVIKERGKTWVTKPKGMAARNGLFWNYCIKAKRHNQEFTLTKDEFSRFTSSNCFYCGAPPEKEFQSRKSRFMQNDGRRIKTGELIPSYNGGCLFNGLDRIDSSMGYVLNNVVPCCWTCNQAKSNMSQEAFYGWVVKIHSHLTSIGMLSH